MSQTCDTAILPDRRSVPLSTGDGSRDHEFVYHASLLAGCAAVLIGSAVLRPTAEGLSLWGWGWPFHCWLHETLGMQCALCGMSRSFCSLAHGDLAASVRFHPLGSATFALVCLEVPYRLYCLARRAKRPRPGLIRFHRRAVALVAAVILMTWLGYLGGLIL